MKQIMWNLEEVLKIAATNDIYLGDKWVPARPLNYTKQYTGFFLRLKRAWAVFTCKADCFLWPQNQKDR